MADAEIYDPKSGHFIPTDSMNAPRSYFKVVLLSNGKVLVTGGFSSGEKILQSAEVYDPANGQFHLVGAMAHVRYKERNPHRTIDFQMP